MSARQALRPIRFPSLIALSAVVVIACRGGSHREVPIEQFCTGPGKNVLQAGEIVVEFRLPAAPANSGSHYRRFIPRNEMDIAVVGVGAAVTLDESTKMITSARIGIGAVARPRRYLRKRPVAFSQGSLLMNRPTRKQRLRP